MTNQRDELLRQFINKVEKLALEIPPPNAHTPQLLQVCNEARVVLNRLENTRPAAQGETRLAERDLEAARRERIKMYLCETERLFLKPNEPYLFLIHPKCERCKELAQAGEGLYERT